LVLRANENSILPAIEISLMPFSLLVGWTFLTPIYPFAAFNELFSFASFSSQIECRVTRVRITEWFKVIVWKTQNSKLGMCKTSTGPESESRSASIIHATTSGLLFQQSCKLVLNFQIRLSKPNTFFGNVFTSKFTLNLNFDL